VKRLLRWLTPFIPRHRPPQPQFIALSDRGDREVNQDFQAHLTLEQGRLLVVADGLGGHSGGEISEQEMADHPEQSLLTRSISVGEAIRPSTRQHDTPLQPGECLLLCSDGLWEGVSEQDICALARAGRDLELPLRQLVNKAKAAAGGQSDNITAQLGCL
jgi:serine/threonine protein phosphatase PrpC